MIFDTIKHTVATFKKILPEFSQVSADFEDSNIFVNGSIARTRYVIVIGFWEHDTIVSYDTRVESVNDNGQNCCEYEFNNESMTLDESIKYAFEWVKKQEEVK